MKRPPLSIIFVCLLSLVSTSLQFWRGGLATISGQEAASLGLAAPVAIGALAVFVLRLCGLWFMRRWAAVLTLLIAIVNPIQMTIDLEGSFLRYPLLGPLVSWFWFGIVALCIVPHWRVMTWRIP